jgi:hypothetical protein
MNRVSAAKPGGRQANLDDLSSWERRRGRRIEADDVQDAPARADRGLDREPGRGRRCHVEVAVAPGDLDEGRLREIVHFRPERARDVGSTDDDRRVPAVVEHPDADGRLVAAAQGALRDARRAATCQHDDDEQRATIGVPIRRARIRGDG